jgi:L-alanine-DL-glutamate epimerase-like enolase superfamily enzyme
MRTESGNTQSVVGEASIDFPFSHYDAWDIFYALSHEQLVGQSVFDRERLLDEAWERRKLDGCFAAQAALNMALDDAYGSLHGRVVSELYGCVRTEGVILESVGIPDNQETFISHVRRIVSSGRIPKIKCDEDMSASLRRLLCAIKIAEQFQTSIAADFNATLTLEQWETLILELRKDPFFSRLLFVEQPTRVEFGLHGICEASAVSRRCEGPLLVADESFLCEEDAVVCGQHSIGMNMKIQKVGGLRVACALEHAASTVSAGREIYSMVGGTFPTALGRVNDQHAACVLKSATLPSDGWQPASDWFVDDKHIMCESFSESKPGYAKALTGAGLGCTPDWRRIQKWIVQDPEREYRRIRETGEGEQIVIHTGKKQESYAAMYERLSGRNRLWNL